MNWEKWIQEIRDKGAQMIGAMVMYAKFRQYLQPKDFPEEEAELLELLSAAQKEAEKAIADFERIPKPPEFSDGELVRNRAKNNRPNGDKSMETKVIIGRNLVFITDYETDPLDINPLDIRLRWVHDRYIMRVSGKSLPITNCQAKKLPSGDVQLSIALQFPSNSVFFDENPGDSPCARADDPAQGQKITAKAGGMEG